MANVYGPRQDRAGEGGVVSIFCSRAKKGEPIEVFGDGEQTRDYVYVGDVADAFVRSLSLSKTITANIGTGQETSINELIKAIEGVTGAKIQRVERAPRMGEIRNSSLSIECARKHLDWQPTTSLQAGLKLTADQL
jgi:UDP-glucose 4-epimerase